MTVEITCYECGEPVRSCDDLFRCTCSRCGICRELTAECVCEDRYDRGYLDDDDYR